MELGGTLEFDTISSFPRSEQSDQTSKINCPESQHQTTSQDAFFKELFPLSP